MVNVSQCVSQEWMKDYIYKRWKCWVSRLLSAVFSGRLRSRGLRAQESTFWNLRPNREEQDLSTSCNSFWNPMISCWYPAAQKTIWFPEDVSHALWGLLRISEQTSRAFKLKGSDNRVFATLLIWGRWLQETVLKIRRRSSSKNASVLKELSLLAFQLYKHVKMIKYVYIYIYTHVFFSWSALFSQHTAYLKERWCWKQL